MEAPALKCMLRKHPLLFILGIAGSVIMAVFLPFSASAAVLVFFIIAEIVLASAMGIAHLGKFGFELVTATCVLGGVLYGPAMGAVLGVVLSIAHYLLSQSFGPYVFYSVPMYAVVGGVSGLFAGSDIAVIGVGLSAAYNIITAGIGAIINGDFSGELVWSATNLAINIVLFTSVVPSLI